MCGSRVTLGACPLEERLSRGAVPPCAFPRQELCLYEPSQDPGSPECSPVMFSPGSLLGQREVRGVGA